MTFVAPLGLTVENSALRTDLATGLAAVEDLLSQSTSHADPFIARSSSHLFAAGGKRFRPLLMLLSAQFGELRYDGAIKQAIINAAAAVELTHLATLYHDDVMDSAEMRRGVTSSNVLWDNKVSVLTGDLLFSKASLLMAGLGEDAITAHAATAAQLISGQIAETVGPSAGIDAVAHYQRVLREKTGSLISVSCYLGALLADAEPSCVKTLQNFGELVGICFQLGDDLLDITAAATESGKTPGTDLREGVATLPVLYALESSDPADENLRELLQSDLSDDATLAEALKLLRAHPAMDRTRAELVRRVEDARALLQPLPETPARQALSALCDAAVWRTH